MFYIIIQNLTIKNPNKNFDKIHVVFYSTHVVMQYKYIFSAFMMQMYFFLKLLLINRKQL